CVSENVARCLSLFPGMSRPDASPLLRTLAPNIQEEMAFQADSRVERVVMLRYGEIFLKSEPVKRHFVGTLLRNCTRALGAAGLSHRAEVHRGRVILHGECPEEIASIVSRLFGVVDVSICTLTLPDPRSVTDAAVALASI